MSKPRGIPRRDRERSCEIRQARGRVQEPSNESDGRVNSQVHQPTRALAAFAAQLDPAQLPDDVRHKLGWLLLDHLRVCSIGARLPWSGWARDYVGVVGKAGRRRMCCSRRETLNPQHATFLNVTFGSSFDADDTHVGAMLHPGIAAWSAALATAEHVGASGRRGAGGGRCRLRGDDPGRAFGAARPLPARLPEHRHLRRVRHRRGRRPAAVRRRRASRSSRRSGSPAAIPAASRSSTTRALPASASRPRMPRRAASPRRC